MSIGPDNGVVISAPNGSQVTAQPSLGHQALIVVAGDGRFLATGTGRLIAVKHNTFVDAGVDVSFPRPSTGWRVVGFADCDLALVAVGNGPGQSASTPIDVASFAGHQVISLGTGDVSGVAGDPQALGAFVPVASPHLIAPGEPFAEGIVVDTRVELRDAGLPPVVLATTAGLATDLDQPPATPLQLSALPDLKGDRVAVVVSPASRGNTGPGWAGIVVLDRHGRLLGTVTSSSGLGGGPAWSPDGKSLVYYGVADGHVELTVWSIGHQPHGRSGPTVAPTPGETFLNFCLWSLDGSGVLCTVDSGGDPSTSPWVIGRPDTTTPLQSVSGPGLPLAWLPP